VSNAQRFHALAHLMRLLLTFIRQRTVGLPLNASGRIPNRFTVTNKIDL